MQTKREADLEEWLSDLREFLEDQADADCDGINQAMRLLVELKRLFPGVE